MKFLFDQNLLPRLVVLLEDIYPGSLHVRDVRLHDSSDTLIWEYAKTNNFTIVSKDSDVHQRSFVFCAPPKVI
ncbi:MAG: DUF5615 family PIN-like protein [Chlorobi bacterium]|nr:DUF5615 family PIN-like protein [Chlorobiota bacterium]